MNYGVLAFLLWGRRVHPRRDRLDLLQFHEVIRMSDPERIFAPGGALEAVMAAKKQGELRYIGFTGHKAPAIHLHMLEVAEKHPTLPAG